MSNSKKTLQELIVRILCDVVPNKKTSAAYLFENTMDNEGFLFSIVKDIYQDGETKKIAIYGASQWAGYRGAKAWKKKLKLIGIGGSDVEIIQTEGDNHNTFTEAMSLVKHAKKNKWRAIYIITASFHQIRAFISVVSVAKKIYPQLLIYNRAVRALDWSETVKHSQGTLVATRSELIGHEFDRIARYNKKGDLVSIKEALAYLNNRND